MPLFFCETQGSPGSITPRNICMKLARKPVKFMVPLLFSYCQHFIALRGIFLSLFSLLSFWVLPTVHVRVKGKVGMLSVVA